MTTIEICSVYACASQVAQLVKNPPAIVGDLGSITGLGRFPAEGKGYLLQYFSLSHRILQDTENIVSEYWKYSSEYWAPGQRIPWTVLSSPWGHKDSDTTEQLSLWQRKWQPTPVFLPGKSHGQRSLAGYNPWGSKEWDSTKDKDRDMRLAKYKI